MQYSKILLLLTLALACLTSCHPSKYISWLDQSPTPAGKRPHKASLKTPSQTLTPSPKNNQTLVFESLYRARLDTLAYNRTEALANIKEAQQLLQGNKTLGNIAEPTVKIIYTRNGMNIPCYLPLAPDNKYSQLEDLLQTLQAKNVKPGNEYELVTFNMTIQYDVATALLNEAVVLIEQASIDSPAQGFILADKKIQKIYTALGPAVYKAENHLLMENNTDLAQVFFDYGHYDLTRQALTQAENHLKKQELENSIKADKTDYLTDYMNKIAELRAKLEKKDPNVLKKFSNNIGGFLNN